MSARTFQGHVHRLHRGAASVQAQWLLLPDHRRGRHGLGSRHDDGAFTLADRAVRTASRQVHRHGAGSSRCAVHRAGHGDLVETQAGDTYAVYLCGRPLPNRGRCVLGRETAIQKMVWGDDGWLRTLDGSGLPELETPAPGIARRAVPCRRRSRGLRRHAAADRLPVAAHAVARRIVQPERAPRVPAAVRPRNHRQYLPAVAGGASSAGTLLQRDRSLEFEPAHYQQAAGLVCYYNSSKFHYLHVSHDEEHGRHLRVMSCVPDLPQSDVFTAPIPIPAVASNCASKWTSSACASRTALATGWNWLPELFDASILSDEATAPGSAQLHRCLRRHGLPGHVRHGASGGFRLLRVPGTGIPGANISLKAPGTRRALRSRTRSHC